MRGVDQTSGSLFSYLSLEERDAGDRTSDRIRKRIEEIFGWVKVQGGQRQTRCRGRHRVEVSLVLALTTRYRFRLPGLMAAAPP